MRAELLSRLAREGSIASAKPAWMMSSNAVADAYALLGENVALPLRRDGQGIADYVAVTCLFARGGYGFA